MIAGFVSAAFVVSACATGAEGEVEAFDGGATDAISAHTSPPGTFDAGSAAPAPLDSGYDAGADPGPDTSVPTPIPDAGGGGVDAAPAGSGDASAAAALIGKWTFDEGSGTTSADLSAGGHPATLTGGASWADAGKSGAGLALDGTTGYADVGATVIDTARGFSVLCWAKLTVVNAWEVMLSQDDVTGSLFGLKLRGDATNAFDFDVETSDVTNPAFVVAQSTTTAAAQTWVHLAGVYDPGSGGTLKIYVNGAMQADAAVGVSIGASNGHFVIGRGLYDGVTGSFVNGTLDDVEVYSAALTGAQVSAIYGAEQ